MNLNKEIRKTSRELKKVIKKQFGYSSFYNSFFCADIEKEKVGFCLLVTDKVGKQFMADLRRKYNARLPFNNLFTWSILHEVGHLITKDDVIEYQYEERIDLDEQLKATNNEVIKKRIMEDYFNLESEFLATEWAIDFVKRNLDLVLKIDKKFDNILKSFYEKVLDKEELV